jgi:carboxyl-terminal processing protease
MKLPAKTAAWFIALAVASAACTKGVHGRSVPSVASTPQTTEGNITRLTTNILERSQFAHHPLDTELAGKFLDSYLDALDGSHTLFLQTDVKEFAPYRATLAQATRDSGDISAARVILARFQQRLKERQGFVSQALHAGQFDFTGHDSYSFDREHATRPQDLPAAQALWLQELRADYLQEKLTGATPEQIATRLNGRYTQQVTMMQALDTDELLDIYLNALAHVYDPHSDYLGHEQMESLSIAMNLSLVGIGASLESDEGYCKIREVLPGGPADRGGVLKAGDRIVKVAQAGKEPVDIINMPLSRAVELIRGQKGTTVTLSIIPDGAAEGSVPKLVPLVRDEIQLEDEQASARILDLPDGTSSLRLGVLDLPSFYADMGESEGRHRSVTADVARLLTKLKAEKIQGLIVDLRRNGGGSLNEAISLTGLFIHQGPVVQTRGPAGDVEVDRDPDPNELYDGPLVLLTSRMSASASEILTGALQDYGRALVVGDSATFGKGTVQSVLPLARIMDEGGLSHSYDPGALKVTIRKFYRPNGASTQLRGVASDIVLPSTSDFSDVSEAAMKDPLPWDAVPPAPHEQLNWVMPYVSALREKSAQRVASEKGFAYLADDVARLKKSLADKSISLNEEQRRTELAETKARQHEREEASKNLPPVAPSSYLITLKNAALPGLPPVTAFKGGANAMHAKATAPEPGNSEAESTDRAATEDIILNETVHILADYTALLNHTANPAPGGALTNGQVAR